MRPIYVEMGLIFGRNLLMAARHDLNFPNRSNRYASSGPPRPRTRAGPSAAERLGVARDPQRPGIDRIETDVADQRAATFFAPAWSPQ